MYSLPIMIAIDIWIWVVCVCNSFCFASLHIFCYCSDLDNFLAVHRLLWEVGVEYRKVNSMTFYRDHCVAFLFYVYDMECILSVHSKVTKLTNMTNKYPHSGLWLLISAYRFVKTSQTFKWVPPFIYIILFRAKWQHLWMMQRSFIPLYILHLAGMGHVKWKWYFLGDRFPKYLISCDSCPNSGLWLM